MDERSWKQPPSCRSTGLITENRLPCRWEHPEVARHFLRGEEARRRESRRRRRRCQKLDPPPVPPQTLYHFHLRLHHLKAIRFLCLSVLPFSDILYVHISSILSYFYIFSDILPFTYTQTPIDLMCHLAFSAILVQFFWPAPFFLNVFACLYINLSIL